MKKYNLEEFESDDLLEHEEIDVNEINYSDDRMSIRDLYLKYERGDLILPDFQREYNWTIKKASYLIDTILIGLPMPSIFLLEKIDGGNAEQVKKTFIIDGGHRLKTIFNFIEGNFENQKKKEFKIKYGESKWLDKSFEDLSQNQKNDLYDYGINCITFKPRNRNEWIYEIFIRLNVGSNPLSPQELRNSIFVGEYLKKLKEIIFDVRYWTKEDKEIKDEESYEDKYNKQFKKKEKQIEIALRFLSYYNYFHTNGLSNSFNLNKNNVIDEYLKNNQNNGEKAKEDFLLIKETLSKYNSIKKVFFWNDNLTFSEIIFESLMLGASIEKIPLWLETNNLMEFKNDLNKLGCFTKSTTSPTNVLKRIYIIKYFFKLNDFSSYDFSRIKEIDEKKKGEL